MHVYREKNSGQIWASRLSSNIAEHMYKNGVNVLAQLYLHTTVNCTKEALKFTFYREKYYYFGHILEYNWEFRKVLYTVHQYKFTDAVKNTGLTFLFSKLRILCSRIVITCRIGVLSAASEEAGFSDFAFAAEGILHRQQLLLKGFGMVVVVVE